MQVDSPARGRCFSMRMCPGCRAAPGRRSTGRASRASLRSRSFFPAASRAQAWGRRFARCGHGPWMCRAASSEAAGSRTRRKSSRSFGAHKVNNTVGQALVARRMGKRRVIAETGAGMHGVAAATVAARYGMECVVYMGTEDVARQAQNVYRMKLLGATVVPVESGSRTLKDALNEAMRDWVTNVENTFYIIGTVAGPHPYPMMVRDFNSIVGKECLTQVPAMAGRNPDVVLPAGAAARNRTESSKPPIRNPN